MYVCEQRNMITSVRTENFMMTSTKPETHSAHYENGISDSSKQEMYDTFQSWALQNYGDSGKTKTVTKRKYDRIVRILSGMEESSTENSKFRFWVKAKGFRLGPLKGELIESGEKILYVPVKQSNDSNFNETAKEYKRVAIVEQFFDIIYGVHVEMDGRGGKHAGQKRTYRAIAETYSFLPREAVTRFLMACSDCQKRMHLGADSHVKMENNNDDVIMAGINGSVIRDQPPIIDFSVPITQTYLNHMRSKGCYTDDSFLDEDSSSGDSEMSQEDVSSPTLREDGSSPRPETAMECIRAIPEKDSSPVPPILQKPAVEGAAMEDFFPINMTSSKSSSPSPKEDRGHPERKRRASDDSIEGSSKASETGTSDDPAIKEDDDDDDNDDDEKVPAGSNIDPERLKSFNMFCRLFVDENLDRMVPISKQPKDKIQAILDACDRQFPEFHERSRKRIRTYLKSCRRMRRSKEQNGWEPLRPTPPHLTSAAAESYLAQACENESLNAKRMRMGLEPLPATAMTAMTGAPGVPTQPPPPAQKQTPQPSPPQQPVQTQPQVAGTPQAERHTAAVTTPNEFIRHQPPPAPAPAFRPPPEFHPPFFTNGNGLFRAGFPPGYQHPAHHHPPVLHSPIQPATLQNGPTDLSMKKQSSKNQLSPSEVATIKQLIAGYRESAAFLYRSADELEQLLLQQN